MENLLFFPDRLQEAIHRESFDFSVGTAIQGQVGQDISHQDRKLEAMAGKTTRKQNVVGTGVGADQEVEVGSIRVQADFATAVGIDKAGLPPLDPVVQALDSLGVDIPVDRIGIHFLARVVGGDLDRFAVQGGEAVEGRVVFAETGEVAGDNAGGVGSRGCGLLGTTGGSRELLVYKEAAMRVLASTLTCRALLSCGCRLAVADWTC